MSSVIRILALAFLLTPSRARAVSNYHDSDTLICADCHTMHFSMQHGYQGGPVSTQAQVGGNWLPPGEPNADLLKLPKDQLCVACHDGSGVLAPNVISSTLTDSAGGAFAPLLQTQAAVIGGRSPGGHPLGAPLSTSMTKLPAAQRELGCASCHSSHGNNSFRNLRADPAGKGEKHLVVARVVTPETKAPLSSAARLEASYASGNIVYQSGMSEWCSSCHSDVLGHGSTTSLDRREGSVLANSPSVSVDAWMRVTDARVRVERPSGDARPSPSDRVFCLTCHRAHGSGNHASLIFADGQTVTSTCQQCHDE